MDPGTFEQRAVLCAPSPRQHGRGGTLSPVGSGAVRRDWRSSRDCRFGRGFCRPCCWTQGLSTYRPAARFCARAVGLDRSRLLHELHCRTGNCESCARGTWRRRVRRCVRRGAATRSRSGPHRGSSHPSGPAVGIFRDNVDRLAKHYRLTRKETEVFRELAQRHTNAEIADACFITIRTAQDHVQHIMNKLGVNTRWDAAARLDDF